MKKINGFTLIEVMIAILILGFMLLAIMNLQYFIGRQSIKIKDQTFATQKVIQMIEELRALS